MDMVELYVREVGQHLPAKMRDDIEKEIRSSIEDTIEDQSKSSGKAVDDEMVVEVLKKCGPPQKMAASYLPPRYLVGPQLYPYLVTTVKVVVSIIAVIAVLLFGISLGFSSSLPQDTLRLLSLTVSGLFNAAIQAVGIIVIIFAIIERTTPQFKPGAKTWDPRKMKAEPNPEFVKPAGQVMMIIFNVILLVVFNLYPEWIGLSWNRNGQWFHVPVLTTDFSQYLPWISLIWALQAGLSFFLLTQGRQTAVTRWFSIGLNLYAIGLGLAILFGPAIVGLDTTAMSKLSEGIPGIDFGTLSNQWLIISVRIIIALSIVGQLVEMFKSGKGLLRRG